MAFYYTVEMAKSIQLSHDTYGDDGVLYDIMPGVLATGALLKHCFPEEFEEFDDTVNEPVAVPKPGRFMREYKPTFEGRGYQIGV